MSNKCKVQSPHHAPAKVIVEAESRLHTRYGGVLAYQQAWQQFGMNDLLQEVGIHYGQQEDKASAMSFALSSAPLIEADSVRKVAQRFGGEASELEQDELLKSLLPCCFNQRALARFSDHPRHNWMELNWARVERLQMIPEWAMRPEGILILDDFTLAKPYARQMAYLSPVWDNCLKRRGNGYLVGHLYYYHPTRPSYSLWLEPWRKTSATGETGPPANRRRARAGEELSRLDLGLAAIEQVKARAWPFQVVVMDCWYTVRWLCAELSRQAIAWIGEASVDRKFELEGQRLKVPEIWERYADRLRPLVGFNSQIKAYALPADHHGTRFDQPIRLILTEGLYHSSEEDEGRHLLMSNQLHWSTIRLVRLFSYRPQIEAVHRLGKQAQGWLEFHARTFSALLAHLALALVRDTLLRLLRFWLPGSATYSWIQMIAHWFHYMADLSYSASGQLQLHIARQHPALAFMTDLDPPVPALRLS